MNVRHAAIALIFLALLAGCSSSAASRPATGTATSSTAVTPTTAAVTGTMMRWRVDTVPSAPKQECSALQQCVLLGTETGTVDGDLRGTFFRGNAAAFGKQGHFVVGTTGVFRGTVEGCGSGTLVLVGTELADVHSGSGEWRIAEGFGTGDLGRATGHGTGTGSIEGAGFKSQWEGVIDCGN